MSNNLNLREIMVTNVEGNTVDIKNTPIIFKNKLPKNHGKLPISYDITLNGQSYSGYKVKKSDIAKMDDIYESSITTGYIGTNMSQLYDGEFGCNNSNTPSEMKKHVILGGGPMGLMCGIKLLLHSDNNNYVTIIENRSKYTREQIILLQNGLPNGIPVDKQYKSIDFLKNLNITKLNITNTENVFDYLKNKGCFNNPPPRTKTGKCYNESEKPNENFFSIKLNVLEKELKKIFLMLGGGFINPTENEELTYNIIEQRDHSRTGKPNTIDINIKNKLDTSKFMEMNIRYNTHDNLFVCIGGPLGKNTSIFKTLAPNGTIDIYKFDKSKKHNNKIHNNINSFKFNIQTYQFERYGLILYIDENKFDTIKHSDDNLQPAQHEYRIFRNKDINEKSYIGIQLNSLEYQSIFGIHLKDIIKAELSHETYKQNYDTVKKNIDKKKYIDDLSTATINSLIYSNEILKLTNTLISIQSIKFHFKDLIEKKLTNLDSSLKQTILDNIDDNIEFSIFPIIMYNFKADNTNSDTYCHNKENSTYFIGDSFFGVHFFSGTGINIGIKNLNKFFDINPIGEIDITDKEIESYVQSSRDVSIL